MQNYKPNFSDPRVRRKCLGALEFVEKYISKYPKPVAQSQINKHFGLNSHSLGGYLRSQLLICTDEHWNMLTGKCKKYVRNTEGFQQLKQALGLTTDIISKELETQIQTGEFEYAEISDRWYNPIQQKPRIIRNKEMAQRGYRYDYDIENASASLLYQYAQRLQHRNLVQNLTENTSNEVKTPLILPHIERYLQKKTEIREQIANDCGCDAKSVKKTITALFQGAQLSRNERCRLFWDLDGDRYLIEKLKQNTTLCELRKDIKSMWKIIKEEIWNEKLTQKLVKEEDKSNWRLCGRDKAELYRKLEREVMGVIWGELKRANIAHLKIHDGWMSNEVCDMQKLIDQVRLKTGYHIQIDWAILPQHI